jgi:hypothetical protein
MVFAPVADFPGLLFVSFLAREILKTNPETKE